MHLNTDFASNSSFKSGLDPLLAPVSFTFCCFCIILYFKDAITTTCAAKQAATFLSVWLVHFLGCVLLAFRNRRIEGNLLRNICLIPVRWDI